MSTTFNLTNSATEVNTAIQAVVGADTTPDAASANMVTSQGVFNYVNAELGPFKGKTITLEGTGIAATDNDTSVPSSAAVKDYVDNNVSLKYATYTAADASDDDVDEDTVIALTEETDASNIGTVSNGTVTLSSGAYLVAFSGTFSKRATSGGWYGNFQLKLRHNGATKGEHTVTNTTAGESVSFTRIIVSNTSQTVDVFANEVNGASELYYQNVALSIIKIA